MSKVGKLAITLFFAGGFTMMGVDIANVAKHKKELQQLDPQRYENAQTILNSKLIEVNSIQDAKRNATMTREFWRNEYQAVQDSLSRVNKNDTIQKAISLDGASKKAYFEAGKKLKKFRV